MTIAIAAQFIVGAIIDHWGILGADLRPLNHSRCIGVAVMLLGTWIVVR